MTITRHGCWKSERGSALSVRGGFTLAELLAVVAIIVILVSLLCAALNSTKSKALRITCLDNLRELQKAWAMYADENFDQLPLNQSAPIPNKPGVQPHRLSADSWVTGNPVQDASVDNIIRGSLFPYVRSTAVYRCPMDDSAVAGHPDILRTRSYSIDAYLGGDSNLDRPPKMRLTELNRTDNIFVFIEEHEASVWESSFLVFPRSAPTTDWISRPADRHARGCNISFADGHIEYWRWYAQKESAPGGKQLTQLSLGGTENADLRRLQACVP